MPITLDGTLDDDAWALADSTRDVFYQSIPNQGMPSAADAVGLRVLYDDVRLYIGAIMYDSNGPGALVSAGLEQDFSPRIRTSLASLWTPISTGRTRSSSR